jgi:hypothetical protein
MRRVMAAVAVLIGTLTAGLVTAPTAVSGATSPTVTAYDTTISPNPVSLPSEGFEATSTSEMGQQVAFSAGTSRSLSNVVVDMDSWACQTGDWTNGPGGSTPCTTTPGATFSQPLTLNIYNVGPSNAVGTLISTVTQTFNIPYRPTSAGCADTTAFLGADNACYHGMLAPVTFTFPTPLTVPNSVIYGIAFNTTNYGASPVGGSGGPYDSLNLALNDQGTGPSVGTDPAGSDSLYQNSSWSGAYCSGGTGTFRIDDGLHDGCWTPYEPAVQFNVEPTCTTTCYVSASGNDSNSGQADSPFATIQHAINTASSGGTVHVGAGTYNENVSVAKPLTLLGANAGIRATGATRSAESTISTSNVSGDDYTVDIASSGVTLDGFTLQQTATVTCNYCAAFGVQVEPIASGATVADNIISGMATSGTSPAGAGNPIGVDIGANSTTSPNNVTVARNLITSISSSGTQHRSALGIEVGDSTSHPVSTGLVIANNHITGISSAGWGGYGMIMNRQTTGTVISGNTIDTVFGAGWSRGIGLEATETGASVANNAISAITTANASPGAADDVYFDTIDAGAGSSTATNNSLTGTATTAGILNLAGGTVNGSPNWWGCPNGPGSTGCSAVSGPVTIFPGIAAYTPDPAKAGQPGFWPTAVTLWSNTSAITSAASVQAAVGKNIRFTVTTHGNPAATISIPGLPAWMTMKLGTRGKAGTANLSGKGPVGGGDFTFTIHASNGPGPDTTQLFTVHVLAISSPASANFSKSGPPTQSFTITTTGAGTGVTLSANLTGLETGLTFHDNGNGTATLSGTPAAGDKTHLVKITATSGAAITTQKLAVGISS